METMWEGKLWTIWQISESNGERHGHKFTKITLQLKDKNDNYKRMKVDGDEYLYVRKRWSDK